MLRPSEQEVTWQSSGTNFVRRSGFNPARASCLTSTLPQGQTLRRGVTIDCARDEDAGRAGMSDEQWWLHLYAMFSRRALVEHADPAAAHAGH
eukprot:7076544-Pyramimonas_sp.AAC.1